MYPGMYDVLVRPLLDSQNPVVDIHLMMKNLLLETPFFEVKYGCPAVNLIDEMASVHASFKKALSQLFGQCQEAIQASIQMGKKTSQIRNDVDPGQVACFVMAGYSGFSIGLLLIFLAIPWPFSPLANRPYFRSF